MPRRRVVAKREILPDPKFHNQTVAKFINHVMVSGKKAVAERIVYGALTRIEERENPDPVEIFEKALEAVAPFVEVKSRRVGGATYQVPLPSRPARARKFTPGCPGPKLCSSWTRPTAVVRRSKNAKTRTVWQTRIKRSPTTATSIS